MDVRDQRALVPRKLLEAAFRNLWILLAPMLLLPIAVTFLTQTSPIYQSGATIWVSIPEGVDTGPLSARGSSYLSPAANQVQVLADLLSTRAFRTDIAIAAKLILPASSEADLTRVDEYVLESVSVSAIGTNLVGLAVSTPIAQDSFAIATAFISQYQTRATEESTRDAAVKIAYYDEQIGLAQKELDRRRGGLIAYVALHPTITDPNSRVYDADYERLKASLDQQTKLTQDLTTKRFEVELNAKSSEGAQSAVFNVQDPPRFATSAEVVSITKRFGLPVAALLFGALIAVTFLYIVFRLDQTIRTGEDLESLGVPLLGYVPEIQKGPGAGIWEYTPFAWLIKQRQKGYARKVAASIASIPVHEGRA